jgi:hypothetical protein
VPDDNEELNNEELNNEEQLTTQRFSVVVIWSADSDERIIQGDLQSIIHDSISDLDEDATVEVSEVIEPSY